MRSTSSLILALLLTTSAWGAAGDDSGEALYRAQCAPCHEQGVPRAPAAAALRQLPADSIRAALTTGAMREQGLKLTPEQREALTSFLAGAPPAQAASAPLGECTKEGGTLAEGSDPFTSPHWNGWGAGVEQHRFQPAAMAGLAPGEVPRLKLKWAFGFPGTTRAGAEPAVVGGWLFVGGNNGKVYALDARSGCLHWTFDADGPVRTAINIGKDQRGLSAYFGDQRANAYGVDARTGKLLWKTRVDDHPAAKITGAPILAGGVLYVPVSSGEEVSAFNPQYSCCSFRGSVAAIDVATGKQLWKSYTIAEAAKPTGKNQAGIELRGPSGAAIWSSPTVDLAHRMLYVTTGDNYSDPPAETSDAFMAFHLEDGTLAWSRQMTAGDAWTLACGPGAANATNCPESKGPDFDFGSSPILVERPGGARALIAGQKSGMVHALDPDRHGAVIWQRRVGEGGPFGGVQWGSAADEHNVYVAVSDIQSHRVAAGTAGAQPSAYGPAVFVLDPKAGGGLYALSLATGEVVWHRPHPGCGETPGCSPAQSAAVTAIPGVVFSGGIDGHLRAYAASTGEIIWDADTRGDYRTVNGLDGHGGSIDGPGAVIVAGMVYTNSGYAFSGSMPGDVLLAYSVSGQ
jgi:polyvinyl alcohol dehydrogenase (cytochrome)